MVARWREGREYSYMTLGQLSSPLGERNEAGPYYTPYTKIYSREKKIEKKERLKRKKTLTVLVENMGEYS